MFPERPELGRRFWILESNEFLYMGIDSDISRKIRSDFTSRGIERGGILFLSGEDAIAMIHAFEKSGVPVLGVDGFVIKDNSTQPDMANSIDLSIIHEFDCWKLATQFVEGRKLSELSFEIVV